MHVNNLSVFHIFLIVGPSIDRPSSRAGWHGCCQQPLGILIIYCFVYLIIFSINLGKSGLKEKFINYVSHFKTQPSGYFLRYFLIL